MSKKTEQSIRCHHEYFNDLMARLDQSRTPTVEKALQLIADMQIHKYSTRYITCSVYTLQQHPRADIHARFLGKNKKVRIAIQNLKGAQVITEDTRIPVVPSIVRELAEIADRDFTPKLAITMKAILWIGTTCMLQKDEMAGTVAQPACITCQSFQLHQDKTGMTITFHGWKMKSFRWSILCNFIEGTQEQAYNDIRNYFKIRDATTTPGTVLFMDDREKLMTRWTLEQLLYHLVDHSSYTGLNITLHSMHIGGATIRHKLGTEIRKIMRMGRWTDITVNSYIRPELILPPEILKHNKDYHTKRSYRMHLMCPNSCSETPIDQLKIKNYESNHAMSKEELASVPDGRRLHILEYRRMRMTSKEKHERLHVPQRMIEVKRIMLSNYKCTPMEHPGEISPFHIVENFEGSQTWFNLVVYLTNKCWRQFTAACKYGIKAEK